MEPKARAHAAVHAAVAAGSLAPAQGRDCAECGGTASIYHHHLGYAPEHWLTVEPLCRPCHRRHHPSGSRSRDGEEEAITIRFKPHVAAELKVLAREEHRSINGTVVEAVERYLRARRGRGQPSQPKDGQDAR